MTDAAIRSELEVAIEAALVASLARRGIDVTTTAGNRTSEFVVVNQNGFRSRVEVPVSEIAKELAEVPHES